MAAYLPLGKGEVRFLDALRKEGVSYVVVGLSAAALQGAPVVTMDVDLWFRDLDDPGIRKALRRVGGIFVPSMVLNPPTFAGENVELFDIVTHMHGLKSFEEEQENVIKVRVGRILLPVLRLDRVIASKKATGRPKDRAVLRALTASLAALEPRRGRRVKRGTCVPSWKFSRTKRT